MSAGKMHVDEVDTDVSADRCHGRPAIGNLLAQQGRLNALPYYHSTNPVLAAIARRAIDEVLAT